MPLDRRRHVFSRYMRGRKRESGGDVLLFFFPLRSTPKPGREASLSQGREESRRESRLSVSAERQV